MTNALFETLESRRLLAVLNLNGTADDNTFLITGSPGQAMGSFTVNDFTNQFNWADVDTININGGIGHNSIDIQYTRADINVNGGNGGISVDIGAGDLDTNILGRIAIDGGLGLNLIQLHDQDDVGVDQHRFHSGAEASTVYYSKGLFSSTGGGISAKHFMMFRLNASDAGSNIDVDVTKPTGLLEISGGEAAEQVTVSSTAGTGLSILGWGGDDALRIGQPGGGNIASLQSQVSFNGGDGDNRVEFDDSLNAGALTQTYTLSSPGTIYDEFTMSDWDHYVRYSSGSDVSPQMANARPTDLRIMGIGPDPDNPGAIADIDIDAIGGKVRRLFHGNGDLGSNVHANVHFDAGFLGEVYFDDTQDTAGLDNYTFSDGKLKFGSPFLPKEATWANVQKVRFLGSAADDTFRVRENFVSRLELYAGSGNDKVIIEGDSLKQNNGLYFHGGAGQDRFIVDHDVANPVEPDLNFVLDTSGDNTLYPNTPYVDARTDTNYLVGRYLYTSFASVEVLGSGDDETFTTRDLPLFTQAILKGGDGEDRFDINGGGDFGPDLKPGVVVSGQGGFDTLRINHDGGIGAKAILPESDELDSIEVRSGGTLVLTPTPTPMPGDHVISTQSLSVFSGARILLGNSAMIVRGGGGAMLAEVDSLIANAYADGDWDGYGIASEVADGANFGIGSALAGDLGISSFLGQSVSSGDVLVRFARYGDANLDGHVDLADFVRLRNGFGGSSSLWSSSNFNYDDDVDLSDFVLLRNNFNKPLTL